MPPNVTTGAMLMCTFGMAPSTLNVLPTNRVLIGGQPAATIMDCMPMVNIPPFGMCTVPVQPDGRRRHRGRARRAHPDAVRAGDRAVDARLSPRR